MTITFILGITLYFSCMAIIGLWASRRVKTMDDYIVSGRRLPFYLAMPTIVATWFGAGSSMGVSGTVYSQGFYGVLADPFGCSLALMIGGLFFAAPFRRLKLLTISDLLAQSYGPRFEQISTWVVIPFYIGTLASQMLALGYVFQIVSGAPLGWGISIGASIIILYTVSGGMWAVTLTDFVQLFLLSVALITIVPVCLNQVSDPSAVFNTFLSEFSHLVPAKSTTSYPYLSLIGRLFMTGLGAIMGQDLVQRFLASKSENVARYSGVIGGGVYMGLGLIPLFIGIAGREIYPHLEKPELLIPLLAKDFLSPLAFTLFACGLFSAIMSTADSYLLAGTTLITNNILLKMWPIQEEKKKISLLRSVNIGVALIALGLAFSGHSIFNLMVHSGTMLFVAIFVPATAALFWKKTHPSAAWGAFFSGIGGWLAFVSWAFLFSEITDDLLFAAAAFGALLSLTAYSLIAGINRKTLASTRA